MEVMEVITTQPNGDQREWSGEAFVGRGRVMSRLRTILKRRKHALIVLSADPGMGKTRVLQEFRRQATDAGWSVVPSPTQPPLSIQPTTTIDEFVAHLTALLEGPSAAPESRPLAASQADVARRLVANLNERKPALVVVDGYTPSGDLAQWFVEQLVAQVRAGGAQVAIVVGDRPDAVEALNAVADESISLGPLERRAVRRHLEVIGHQLDPPMAVSELETYVEAARREPEQLGALTRLLALARPANQ